MFSNGGNAGFNSLYSEQGAVIKLNIYDVITVNHPMLSLRPPRLDGGQGKMLHLSTAFILLEQKTESESEMVRVLITPAVGDNEFANSATDILYHLSKFSKVTGLITS